MIDAIVGLLYVNRAKVSCTLSGDVIVNGPLNAVNRLTATKTSFKSKLVLADCKIIVENINKAFLEQLR